MPEPMSCIYKLSVTLCKYKRAYNLLFIEIICGMAQILIWVKKDSFEKLSFNI